MFKSISIGCVRSTNMRRYHFIVISTLLILSLVINIYYIHLNRYNARLLYQFKVLTLNEKEQKYNLLQATTNLTDKEVPNDFVTKNPLYWKYFQKLFSKQPANNEQFTIVMMTYQRPSLLRKLVPHYCRAGKYLSKFILIWNDVGGVIPRDILNHECDVPLIIKLPPENKLTNRFFPYDEIETDAIFTIDDDRLVLYEDLNFAFESWKQFRHRILGFEFRTHTILSNGTYFYGAKDRADELLGYSLLISANFLVHKAYLEMFNMPEFMNTSMINYVNQQLNCEDLAMCTMAADFLAKVSYPQTSCMGMKAKHFPYNLEAQNNGLHKGLSIRQTHVNGRTRCLNEFRKYYKDKRLPIHYTNVLFIHEPQSYYPKEKS